MTRSISLTRRLSQKPAEGSVIFIAAEWVVNDNVPLEADIFIAAEWVVNGNVPIEIVFKFSNRVAPSSPP